MTGEIKRGGSCFEPNTGDRGDCGLLKKHAFADFKLIRLRYRGPSLEGKIFVNS